MLIVLAVIAVIVYAFLVGRYSASRDTVSERTEREHLVTLAQDACWFAYELNPVAYEECVYFGLGRVDDLASVSEGPK